MKPPRRFDLVAWEAIRAIAFGLGYGALKHKEGTWRHVPIETHLEAAVSHLGEYFEGKRIDEESGLSPLVHAGMRIMFAIAIELRYTHKKKK